MMNTIEGGMVARLRTFFRFRVDMAVVIMMPSWMMHLICTSGIFFVVERIVDGVHVKGIYEVLLTSGCTLCFKIMNGAFH